MLRAEIFINASTVAASYFGSAETNVTPIRVGFKECNVIRAANGTTALSPTANAARIVREENGPKSRAG